MHFIVPSVFILNGLLSLLLVKKIIKSISKFPFTNFIFLSAGLL